MEKKVLLFICIIILPIYFFSCMKEEADSPKPNGKAGITLLSSYEELGIWEELKLSDSIYLLLQEAFLKGDLDKVNLDSIAKSKKGISGVVVISLFQKGDSIVYLKTTIPPIDSMCIDLENVKDTIIGKRRISLGACYNGFGMNSSGGKDFYCEGLDCPYIISVSDTLFLTSTLDKLYFIGDEYNHKGVLVQCIFKSTPNINLFLQENGYHQVLPPKGHQPMWRPFRKLFGRFDLNWRF